MSQTGDRHGSIRVVPSASCSMSPSSCRQHSQSSGASSGHPKARRATMLQRIGGKIAPRPSLPSKRSSIQRRHSATARLRRGRRPTASHALRIRSTARKKRAQPSSPPSRRSCGARGESANNSSILCPGGRCLTGLKSQINDSGTIIVRDHAETRWRLTGNQSGRRTISGGTAGQSAYDICPRRAR